MTATPPDPLATQHDSIADPDQQAPVDAQTLRLREENRALRELLAAQVQAVLPPPSPGRLRRLCWCLISAPGAALVGWRSLRGPEDAPRITGRRVGSATLTVLYTLAIYGALVLLVVSCMAPNNGITGATSASPVRVPLMPLPPLPTDEEPSDRQTGTSLPPAPPPASPAGGADTRTAPSTALSREAGTGVGGTTAGGPATGHPAAASGPAAVARPSLTMEEATPPSSGPHPTLRITEIPAPNPLAWVETLKTELARCAELGFFERPDCAWAARRKFCMPNQGWGVVKECPTQP